MGTGIFCACAFGTIWAHSVPVYFWCYGQAGPFCTSVCGTAVWEQAHSVPVCVVLWEQAHSVPVCVVLWEQAHSVPVCVARSMGAGPFCAGVCGAMGAGPLCASVFMGTGPFCASVCGAMGTVHPACLTNCLITRQT